MEPSRDTTFVRFAAFWWGIGVISLFAIVLLVVRFMVGGDDGLDPLEQAAAIKRYDAHAKVDSDQAAALSWKVSDDGKTAQAPPAALYSQVGKSLLESEPKPVEDAAQVVPGSARAEDLEKNPPADFGAVDEMTPAAGTAPDAEVMAKGQMGYALCMACHGQNGEGGPIAPPLAGSNWVDGPVSNLIRIQFRGLQGPITVSGKEYNLPAPMAAMGAASSNEDVAAVLTYVRNSFGNSAPPVLPEQVEALRGEIGKPMLVEADLIATDANN